MLAPGTELHLPWALWGRTASLLSHPFPEGCGMQLEARFPRQGNAGDSDRDAEGAAGLCISQTHSRREPPVLASLMFTESDPTFAPSKMVLLGCTHTAGYG